ncbi:MAG: DNA polymerase Y family protein [Cyclobacteriaceae bacterium]|nr:DNA polymerase Y family protein [Cyclobacteriaceae bacterium]
MARFISIWFRYLATDWFSLLNPEYKKMPFVLRQPSHGRMIVSAVNAAAVRSGISCGMALADARALLPDLHVLDDEPDKIQRVLYKLAEWCMRFTPWVALDPPDGLFLDATGCAHLWGGEEKYVQEMTKKLTARGYTVRVAMADTPGAAWAVAHYGKNPGVVPAGGHMEALLPLPPEALRLEPQVVERLHKLGLHHIKQFIHLPRAALRKRFGVGFLQQLDKAVGQELEPLQSIQPMEPYHERLPCLEPIVTATGIEIALKQLLEMLCLRLQQGQKGVRAAVFKGHRVDGKVEQISIATSRASHQVSHLFKLFEIKLATIEPALGIELFVLEAPKVEPHLPQQEKMWEAGGGLDDVRLAELVDRLSNKIGERIYRYLPDEHHWPERSFREATSLQEEAMTEWRTDVHRPLHVLPVPERIEVTAPIPDYPPLLFRHKGRVHTIVKADGPERIEQEWWLQQGQHRDYYRVEDDEGNRYWLFRLGHYHDETFQWFLHGYFS